MFLILLCFTHYVSPLVILENRLVGSSLELNAIPSVSSIAEPSNNIDDVDSTLDTVRIADDAEGTKRIVLNTNVLNI